MHTHSLPPTAPAKRRRLLTLCEAANLRCRYCGTICDPDAGLLDLHRATTDHVIPRAGGGRDVAENRALACLACNVMKGSLSEGVFIAHAIAVVAHQRPAAASTETVRRPICGIIRGLALGIGKRLNLFGKES